MYFTHGTNHYHEVMGPSWKISAFYSFQIQYHRLLYNWKEYSPEFSLHFLSLVLPLWGEKCLLCSVKPIC